MRRHLGALLVSMLAMAAPAAAAPCIPSDSPGELGAVVTDAGGLSFCTGVECWRLDARTHAFSSVPRPATPDDPRPDPRASIQYDDRNLVESATFCPTPASCKTFKLAIKVEPVEPPTVELNPAGTLGAIRYVGVPERGLPVWLRLYDLETGKQIRELRDGFVSVFDDSFVADHQIISRAGAVLGKVPKDLHLHQSAPHQDRVAFATTRPPRVAMVDVRTGKTLYQRSLASGRGRGEVGELVLRFSPDHRRLYAITGWPLDGDVWVIDVPTGVVIARARPPVCPAAPEP